MSYSNAIKTLEENPVGWIRDGDSEEGIVLSSRIRLARNIAELRFPIHSSLKDLEYIRQIVSSAVDASGVIKNRLSFKMSELPKIDRRFLLERHLVSKDFCAGKVGSELILESDESFSIMVNEEDHIRMQCIEAGSSLRNIWTKINKNDTILSKRLPFMFNSELGYLTSCPSNVGTGVRASMMLNLPGLYLLECMPGIIEGAKKLGMTVRGLHGEGSEAIGYTYQVSNQTTLGESEEEIINRLEKIIQQIVFFEKNARKILLHTKQRFILDFVGRAYGRLKYSYVISEKEALNSLSVLRMGIDMKMFSALRIRQINGLFISIQDSHLQKICKRELSDTERDIYRADLLRKKL